MKQISHENLTKLVRETAHALNSSGVGPTLDSSGAGSAVEIVAFLREYVTANIHVDLGRKLEPKEAVEWYAGQLLDIVDTKAFFAMNSLLGCLDRHVPEIVRFDDKKMKGVVAFARETWRNDGAEGETVHTLCDAVERLRTENKALSKAFRDLATQRDRMRESVGDLLAFINTKHDRARAVFDEKPISWNTDEAE